MVLISALFTRKICFAIYGLPISSIKDMCVARNSRVIGLVENVALGLSLFSVNPGVGEPEQSDYFPRPKC